MDDQVLRGMAKWPNVPAVYGWLALDRRGRWLLQGAPIDNPTVTAYISRNYACDGDGQWYFQNGPQRVFVELHYTPFVYRAAAPAGGALMLESHTSLRATSLRGAWIDEAGALLVETEHGPGVIHDRDLDTVLTALSDEHGTALEESELEAAMMRAEAGLEPAVWLRLYESRAKVGLIRSDEVPQRFAFVPTPASAGAGASTSKPR